MLSEPVKKGAMKIALARQYTVNRFQVWHELDLMGNHTHSFGHRQEKEKVNTVGTTNPSPASFLIQQGKWQFSENRTHSLPHNYICTI